MQDVFIITKEWEGRTTPLGHINDADDFTRVAKESMARNENCPTEDIIITDKNLGDAEFDTYDDKILTLAHKDEPNDTVSYFCKHSVNLGAKS